MIRDQIQAQMKQAMKDKDSVRLGAIRYLWSEIKNEEIEAKGELTDEQIQTVVKREVKKRKDAIEQMKQARREETAAEEQAQVKILMEFMPEQMSREEIEKVVDQVIEDGTEDFGKVMGAVMGQVGGKADGKLVQEVVKSKLD